MAKKPVVAFVERDNSSSFNDDNPNRDALIYFLRKHCGCDVVVYQHDDAFRNGLLLLQRYLDRSQLILVIVRREEYSDQHEQVFQMVREQLSKSLPVVITHSWDENPSESVADGPMHVFDHTDTKLVDIVDRLVTEWESPADWFGADTLEDQEMLATRLAHAYRAHRLGGDEGAFGNPDRNHMVVAEALRLRLLPPEFLKSEFDDTFEETRRTFTFAEASVYDLEVARIKAFTEKEREAFSHSLMRARGYEPLKGGGVYVTRESCGPDVNGFALDPVTLESHITYRYGQHHSCGDILADRIEAIEALKARKHRYALDGDRLDECRWRIISGLIFPKIRGFTTPLLQLYTYDANEEHVRTVVRFLRQQQRFILVDYDGYLTEG